LFTINDLHLFFNNNLTINKMSEICVCVTRIRYKKKVKWAK
jgi:hypothetical protein